MLLHTKISLAGTIGLSLVGFSQAAPCAHADDDDAAIRPWPDNSWYWQFKGEPVFLAGGTDDDNLFQWPEDQLTEQLDLLASVGGNYVRNTMSDRQDKGFELSPFKQLPDGKYDLEQWNDAYWQRFEFFLNETGKRDVIAQIEVWDRFDYSRNNWDPHPYNPKNNVNYTHESSGLAATYPDHPGANKQPFFYTFPTLRNNEIVFKFQKRFVDKMLSYTLQHGHVLYCMDNETNGAEEWGRWWATYIKEAATSAGQRVYVTEMWDAWNLREKEHQRTFDHPELYDFVDVSQNNHHKWQKHWDNFQWVKQYLKNTPRPVNTVKTYGADGNAFSHTDQDGLERVWRHILGGAAAVRFHRPDSGLGLSAKAQSTLKSIRLLETKVKLWDLIPGNDLLSERDENEAYLATAPGQSYVILFTNGGEVGVNLIGQNHSFNLQWLNVGKAMLSRGQSVPGDQVVKLDAPDEGLWLAVLTRQ